MDVTMTKKIILYGVYDYYCYLLVSITTSGSNHYHNTTTTITTTTLATTCATSIGFLISRLQGKSWWSCPYVSFSQTAA